MLEIVPLDHPRGQGDPAALGAAIAIDLGPKTELKLEGAIIHCGLFEVPYASVMAILPSALHPSTPAYASLTFYKATDSVVGPFDYAVLGVACRSVIRPRMLTLSAFGSTKAVCDLMSSQWGAPCQLAEVQTRRHYDATESSIRLDGRLVGEIHTLDPHPIRGSARAIRYPQALNHVQAGAEAALLQMDMIYEYDESFRGTLRLAAFDSEVMSGGRVAPTDLICGTVAQLGLQMLPPRSLLSTSEVGGVRRLDE